MMVERFKKLQLRAYRVQTALGLSCVGKADLTTGCTSCTSFVLRSNAATVVITAPGASMKSQLTGTCPLPGYDPDAAFQFVKVHGLAVHTIGALNPAIPSKLQDSRGALGSSSVEVVKLCLAQISTDRLAVHCHQ